MTILKYVSLDLSKKRKTQGQKPGEQKKYKRKCTIYFRWNWM